MRRNDMHTIPANLLPCEDGDFALAIDFTDDASVYDDVTTIAFDDEYEPSWWQVRGQFEPRHVRSIEAAIGTIY